MLTDGDTITVGNVVYTWDAATMSWLTPATPDPAAAVIYAQELITPAIRPVQTTIVQAEPSNAADKTPSDG